MNAKVTVVFDDKNWKGKDTTIRPKSRHSTTEIVSFVTLLECFHVDQTVDVWPRNKKVHYSYEHDMKDYI